MNWQTSQSGSSFVHNGQVILEISAMAGCTDSFKALENGGWEWTRTCEYPTDQMEMTIRSAQKARYWQIPSVNYDGNGWGSGAQYSGWACDGKPWTYAWHRVAIPACTYAETDEWAIGLFGAEEGGMSCSLSEDERHTYQSLLWPEQEGPKVLFKRCWVAPFQGKMEPSRSFRAILYVTAAEKPRKAYRKLLDFAWTYFDRALTMEHTPEDIRKLDTLWFRQLWTRQYDGVTGFSAGMHWDEEKGTYVKQMHFEIGWVGQNAAVACSLLRTYLQTGETDLRDKAVSVLDSWVKHAVQPNGLMLVQLYCDPLNVDSIANGDVPVNLDACNLGTAATYFFQAADLAQAAGVEGEHYRKSAMGICDFALTAQTKEGEFAKSWFLDGSVDSAHGSVGAFLILPLFDAHRITGDNKYLQCALRAFEFYYGEFERTGYTTAGALDSYCIDKESAAPLLRAALYCYHATGEARYLAAAEDVAYYLATWQWHYSTKFPEGSMAAEIGYDTYGGTSVSAAHNAQDPYGLYYVPEYLELASLTGNPIWRERARALWYNGIQLISDGQLVIRGRVRPVGSQDESVRHTRWGRTDGRIFVSSDWLVNWSATFREKALEAVEDWQPLR